MSRYASIVAAQDQVGPALVIHSFQLHHVVQTSILPPCKPHQLTVASLCCLVQLAKDRPDVVRHLHSDLNSRLRSMHPAVALAVLGALNELPKGWEKGHKKPADQLAAVAARAEGYAREQYDDSNGSAAAGGEGEGEDGWETAGKETSRGSGGGAGGLGGSGSSSNGHAVGGSGTAAAGAGAGAVGGGSVGAMWKQLQTQRPDVWNALQERHRALIKPLPQDHQKKVIALFYLLFRQ